MSATAQRSSIKPPIRKLGIIAGGGALPGLLLEACDQKGIEPFVVAIEGHADPALTFGREHVTYRLGLAGKMIQALKDNQAWDLVVIGSIKRPKWSSLRPDLKTVRFFAKLGLKAMGDNDMLSAARRELESEGFTLHGVHEFVDNLLAPVGVIGKHKPGKQDELDIEYGFEVSQAIGRMDIGQSVIVEKGLVLGVEAVEGTDALIDRCGGLRKTKKGGVLIKTCKPQQDTSLDLPTIGPDTIRKCAQGGFSGIAVQAGRTLIADLDEVRDLANQHGLFVIGIEPAA